MPATQFEVGRPSTFAAHPACYADASPAPTVEVYDAQLGIIVAVTSATRGSASGTALAVLERSDQVSFTLQTLSSTVTATPGTGVSAVWSPTRYVSIASLSVTSGGETGVFTPSSVNPPTDTKKYYYDATAGRVYFKASDAVTEFVVVYYSNLFYVGQRYWLSSSGGRGFESTLVDITTSGSTAAATLEHSSKFAITGGTIRDHRLSHVLSAGVSTIKRSARVVWRFSRDGEAQSLTQMVDFVKFPFSVVVTDEDLARAYVSYTELSGSKGQYSKYIAQAEQEVYQYLRGQQILPDLCMERELLKTALVYKAIALRHVDKDELYIKYDVMYNNAMSSFLSSKTWYDDDEDLIKHLDSSTSSNSAKSESAARMPVKYMAVG